MDIIELIMKEQHPPHSHLYKKIGLPLLRTLLKIALCAAIFTFSFPFPHPDPTVQYSHPGFKHPMDGTRHPPDGPQKKEQVIQEILKVLEKYPTGLANGMRKEVAEVIYEESIRHNQDPKLILALIATESSFQSSSVSERGAKGLMQIMPFVARSLAREMGIEWGGDRTLFNPFINIRMGIYYLSRLIADFEDFGTALTAYNYGPTYVRSLIQKNEQIPRDFYHKLLDAYKNL
jgi:hypothetical protein